MLNMGVGLSFGQIRNKVLPWYRAIINGAAGDGRLVFWCARVFLSFAPSAMADLVFPVGRGEEQDMEEFLRESVGAKAPLPNTPAKPRAHQSWPLDRPAQALATGDNIPTMHHTQSSRQLPDPNADLHTTMEAASQILHPVRNHGSPPHNPSVAGDANFDLRRRSTMQRRLVSTMVDQAEAIRQHGIRSSIYHTTILVPIPLCRLPTYRAFT